MLMRRWWSGQSQQTVNLSASAYEGSNPSRRTMNIKGEKFLTVLSNLFFLPAFFFAIKNNDLILALLLFSVLIFSTIYHHVKRPGIDWWWNGGRNFSQTTFLFLDTLFAIATFVYVVITTIYKPFTPMIWFAVFICILGFIAYVLPRRNDIYEITHSIWHFFIGVALTLLGISEFMAK